MRCILIGVILVLSLEAHALAESSNDCAPIQRSTAEALNVVVKIAGPDAKGLAEAFRQELSRRSLSRAQLKKCVPQIDRLLAKLERCAASGDSECRFSKQEADEINELSNSPGNVDKKMCYGLIPQETMNALVRKSIAKVGGPQLDNSVDELIYGMLQYEVSTYLGVQPGDKKSSMPAFMMTNKTRLAAEAMTACFTEVQEAVAKQQALIAESKKPTNQLFVAYKLYSHAQFCNQVRQGYLVVWINDVELERVRQVTKEIEKIALGESPNLDTDALWRNAVEAAKTKNSGFYANQATCHQVLSTLLEMSPVSIYRHEKP